MNELQKQNAGQMMATTSQPQGINLFDAEQFKTAQRVCNLLASSELVPEIYKAKNGATPEETEQNRAKAIANCLIALDTATRIGASPLMVMQNMAVIYGRPSWSSTFLIATVNTCGRFEPLQFRFTNNGMVGTFKWTSYEKEWTEDPRTGKRFQKSVQKENTFDGTNTPNLECVAFTRVKGSDEVLESSPVSVMMALQEGWYTKNGSKWQTMTRQMLMYRAASMWTRTFAPELSMGMRTVEENLDIHAVEDAVYEDVTEQVNREKKENANGATITFTDENGNGGTVDVQTGEIKPSGASKDATPDNVPSEGAKAAETPDKPNF